MADLSYRIEIKGLPELQKKLGQSNFTKALKGGMTMAVVNLEGDIKANTPVKSGRLRAAWTHRVSADGSEGQIGNNLVYAPYVEFGTGVYIGKGRIYPVNKKALAWNGTVRRSIAGMKGRFFVQRTWQEEGGPKLIRFFKQSFDEALAGG